GLVALLRDRAGLRVDDARPILGRGEECELWHVTAPRPVVVRIAPPWRSPARLRWAYAGAAALGGGRPEGVRAHAPLAGGGRRGGPGVAVGGGRPRGRGGGAGGGGRGGAAGPPAPGGAGGPRSGSPAGEPSRRAVGGGPPRPGARRSGTGRGARRAAGGPAA